MLALTEEQKKQRRNEKKRMWYLKNREKVKEYNKQYYIHNKREYINVEMSPEQFQSYLNYMDSLSAP